MAAFGNRAINVFKSCVVNYRFTKFSRFLSSRSHSQFFTVDIDKQHGIATLTMNHAPANSFTLPFLTDFLIQWEKLENDKAVRSVIITSSVKGIFSAGIDMAELNKPKEERLREFYKNFQDMWLKLYGTSKITIAAINGRPVAGGCVAAMCCDYRIAVPLDKSYGIAAGRIGLLTPPWVIDTLIHNVGTRKAELMLQSARSFTSQEALAIGVIDEIAQNPEHALQRAREVALEWMKSPSHSHELIKTAFRKQAIDKFEATKADELDSFCSHIMRDSIQRTIQKVAEGIKKNSNKNNIN